MPDYHKYPRTFHFPWSNASNDDKVLPELSSFVGEDVVVTVKMDGENTSLYRDYAHARSLKPLSGSDRGIVKSLHARIAHQIPEGWRLCGENLYAAHSIHYTDLPAWFMVFSIWNDHNVCLSWSKTVAWAEFLGLQMVPTIYEGRWDEKLVKGMYRPEFEGNPCEGYVVRVAREFSYSEFSKVVGKCVRPGHVTSSEHWRNKLIVRNELSQNVGRSQLGTTDLSAAYRDMAAEEARESEAFEWSEGTLDWFASEPDPGEVTCGELA